MFERFTQQARRIVALSQEEARRLNHGYIGTEHLLLGLLSEPESVAAKALADLGITLDDARSRVLELVPPERKAPSGHIPFTARAKKVLELSLGEALRAGVTFIGSEHLLLGMLREAGGVGVQALAALGADAQVVRDGVLARCQSPEYLESGGQPADEAAAAYTPGRRRIPAHPAHPVIGREAELERLLAVLGRRERNNALIVGPSGAGKSALVRGLAQLLADHHGPAALGGAEVLELDLTAVRSTSRTPRREPPLVLVLEDLDTLLDAASLADGRSATRTAAGLISLSDAETPLLVTGTAAGLERLEQTFPAVAARLEVIDLAPAGQAQTIEILQALRPALTEFHRVAIEDAALVAAVEVATLPGARRALPGAAVDVLDTAAARASAARQEGDEERAVLGAEQVRASADGAAGGSTGDGAAGEGAAGDATADGGGAA